MNKEPQYRETRTLLERKKVPKKSPYSYEEIVRQLELNELLKPPYSEEKGVLKKVAETIATTMNWLETISPRKKKVKFVLDDHFPEKFQFLDLVGEKTEMTMVPTFYSDKITKIEYYVNPYTLIRVSRYWDFESQLELMGMLAHEWKHKENALKNRRRTFHAIHFHKELDREGASERKKTLVDQSSRDNISALLFEVWFVNMACKQMNMTEEHKRVLRKWNKNMQKEQIDFNLERRKKLSKKLRI